MSDSRRRFLRLSLLGAASAPLAWHALSGTARAAELPHLSTTDPTAGALGYTEDTGAVDAAKYPNHRAEQACAGCNLAQAPQADGYLPCTIFPGKSVAPKGWCAAYVKRP